MSNGYYIVFSDISCIGVKKKIDDQLFALRRIAEVRLIIQPFMDRSFIKKVFGLLPWVNNKWDYDALFSQIVDPSFIYIRRTIVDKGFPLFLERCRKYYPKCKILIEIPTYPYDKELCTMTNFLLLIKDKFNRKKLKGHVDRFVTFSQDTKIFGIPTICIKNGINLNTMAINSRDDIDEIIDIGAVASFQKAHGYERILRGISEYYMRGGQRKVLVHLVGEGEELERYRSIVKELELEHYVIFYGKQVGTSLDAIYNRMDLALGVFGAYRNGIEKSSALKIREYLAKGLPVISGCYEDAYDDEEFPYFLRFPNDASTVDFEKIINFYDRCYSKSPREVINEIRQFAEKSVDISITFKPVIDFLAE